MKVEHVAWMVEDPVACADWYVANLDMEIVRTGSPPVNMRFLADGTGRVLLEIYNNPKVDVPDYPNIHPLNIHLAFAVDDVPATHARLVAAGATEVSPPSGSANGDEMAMLRDPWGFPIQLVDRAEPM